MNAADQTRPGATQAELAREAIAVQDACNLSGVVHSMARVLSRLRELCPELSSEEIHVHPIAQLWADKIASLARVSQAYRDDWTGPAYREVARLARLCVPEGEHPADRQVTP